MSPKTVYIVRHGQSEGNVAPVFQDYDSPLSDTGREQAEAIAERLQHVAFEALITSPQKRARETAEMIASDTKKKIIVSDLFVEGIKPTSINGKPFTDKKASSVWREWEKSFNSPSYRVEDGENYDDIVARADKALAYLETRKESTLVVVSHSRFIRTIIARILLGDELSGTALRRFYELALLTNTGITVIQYKDAFEEDFCWRLWTFNDHAHFAE